MRSRYFSSDKPSRDGNATESVSARAGQLPPVKAVPASARAGQLPPLEAAAESKTSQGSEDEPLTEAEISARWSIALGTGEEVTAMVRTFVLEVSRGSPGTEGGELPPVVRALVLNQLTPMAEMQRQVNAAHTKKVTHTAVPPCTDSH